MDELTRHRRVAQERAEEAGRVRERLQEARGAMDEVEGRGRELARRGAQLEGDAEASEAQAEELSRRLEQVRDELENTAALRSLASSVVGLPGYTMSRGTTARSSSTHARMAVSRSIRAPWSSTIRNMCAMRPKNCSSPIFRTSCRRP